MNKIVYEDIKRKIIRDLDVRNLMKRRMYWRGFIYALMEYTKMPSEDYYSLKRTVNDYGSEVKDW